MDITDELVIKSGREKSLLRKHPWVFSGSVASVKGNPPPGATVRVLSSEGDALGFGAWSPHSRIRVRMWSFDDEGGAEADVETLIADRISSALQMRREAGVFTPEGGCRLIHAESDRLPGLIADWYAGWICVQFLTTGAEYWKDTIVQVLREETGAKGVYERSDVQVRSQEGLKYSAGFLAGEEPPEFIPIREGKALFRVDVRHGHKTGFYLDQRENRLSMADYAGGKRLLGCFCYTGAFEVHALLTGAEYVTAIDSSDEALRIARDHMTTNGIGPERYIYESGDVFSVLREYRDRKKTFDIIVLDPPKFIESKARFENGCRGYKDIALSAFKILEPGGLLYTFSCSGLLSPELFQKITADAALDAGCDAQVVRRFSQAADHPVLLSFPEGAYLKGLLVRKMHSR